MPKVIQILSVYLPFQLFKYFPTQLILGKLSTADILRGYGMDILWLVIVYILFRLVWRGGLKQYTAVGA
jgi:ABC-2 type transport system permease protein